MISKGPFVAYGKNTLGSGWATSFPAIYMSNKQCSADDNNALWKSSNQICTCLPDIILKTFPLVF